MPSHLFIKVNLLSNFSWGHSLIHCVLPPHARFYCKLINDMYAMMKCRGGRKWRLLNKTVLGFSSPVPPAIFENKQRIPWAGTLLDLVCISYHQYPTLPRNSYHLPNSYYLQNIISFTFGNSFLKDLFSPWPELRFKRPSMFPMVTH